MQAIVQERYGRPSRVLAVREVPAPEPGPDDLLVRVRAASLNAMDWHLVAGRPLIGRFAMGLTGPKERRHGADVAGIVEAVGPGVTAFRPGDLVLGRGIGTFAELAVVPARLAAPVPEALPLETGGTLAIAGATALQAVRDHGRVAAGQSVLVLGAGGGVGVFAVQLAVADGGRVTAVTGPATLEAVRGLGADRVVNRDEEDVRRRPERYDVVIDAGGFASNGDIVRLLAPGGRAVLVGAGADSSLALIAGMAGAQLRSRFGGHRIGSFLARMDRATMDELASLAAAGRIRPLIGRTVSLAEVPAALDDLMAGRGRGKTVLVLPG